ncbi:MAG: hypothetical protein AAFR51_10775 [Pseudomonadota bacterium]
MANEEAALGANEIEYVADVLRAVVQVKDELSRASASSLEELEYALAASEAALRRVAAEIKNTNAE